MIESFVKAVVASHIIHLIENSPMTLLDKQNTHKQSMANLDAASLEDCYAVLDYLAASGRLCLTRSRLLYADGVLTSVGAVPCVAGYHEKALAEGTYCSCQFCMEKKKK